MNHSALKSTFSLISLVVVFAYCGLCVWLKQIDQLGNLAMTVITAYGVKKGIELGQNGHGKVNDVPKP